MDESVTPVEYHRTPEGPRAGGHGVLLRRRAAERAARHQLLLRDGEHVFHTYSTYGRGAEMLGGSYYWLDLTALGRQEEWEEPEGRADSARAAHPDFAD